MLASKRKSSIEGLLLQACLALEACSGGGGSGSGGGSGNGRW